jgi:hypothetical protein
LDLWPVKKPIRHTAPRVTLRSGHAPRREPG